MKDRILRFIKSLTTKNFHMVLVVTHEGPVRAIISEYYRVNFDSKKCDSSSEIIYRIEVINSKIKNLEIIDQIWI